MAKQFGADPRGVRAVGDEVAELNSRFEAVMGTLAGQLAGEGAAIASAVVSGDAKDWHESLQNVQTTASADFEVLGYWANYLKHVAYVTEQSDQAR